jgi:Arc/MetJ-type ribon-helix-helix transcriptional regulator
MATLSVPLTADLEDFIQSMIEDNKAETKAQVVRMALRQAREDKFFSDLEESSDQVKKGEYYGGDLDKLAKNI